LAKEKKVKKPRTKSKRNGEGSIYQRKDGKWVTSLTIGSDPLTNKTKRKDYYTNTFEEAQNIMLKVQQQLKNGDSFKLSKMSLGQWLDNWLLVYKKKSVRPTTYGSYESLIRYNIKPIIGQIQLKNLSTIHVQNLINIKSDDLSARTLQYILAILKQSIDQAVAEGLVQKNICEHVKLPRREKKEIKILSVKDQITFLKSVSEDRLSTAFSLMLSAGLRVGELLALRWVNVNLESGILAVKESVSRVNTFDESSETKTKLIVQSPKTKSGKRNIPLIPSIIEELKRHKHRQITERLKAGGGYENSDLVIATELGKQIDRRNFDKRFKRLLRDASLEEINLHALRHTFATRLLEKNVHPKIAQELLGHASISMTLDTYSHVLPETKREAIQTLDYIFKKETPPIKEGDQ